MARAETLHINLRVSPQLHKRLVKAAASKPVRSLNSEICARLEESLDSPTREERTAKVRENLKLVKGLSRADYDAFMESTFAAVTDWIETEGKK